MHQYKLNILSEIASYNRHQLKKVNYDQNKAKNLIQIDNGYTMIWNPFYDESLINEVNPIDYYGLDAVDKMIKDYKEGFLND